ncbi:M56 family metallopeptidase [Taibaiella chishuiensis]|nr:M56 family metallopeptidase [Taibaiella chishuiensis]
MARLFEHFWTTELCRALCLTFLHSLWEGLLLSLLAAFIIQFSAKASPGKRYNLFALLLGAFALTSGVTFVLCFKHNPTADLADNLATTGERHQLPTLLLALWTALTGFINANANALSLLWITVCGFKGFRLIQDMRQLRGQRRQATTVQDNYWTNRLETLKTRLGIKETVRLKESALLQSPSVAGILKPIILLPLGMLSQLPPEQVEAILLHELAHIRRKDYLVNLGQTLLEALFFFNPFLRWLSAQLRTERENCCDELALEVSGNKTALVHALLSFGQLQLAGGRGLAMALGGRKTLLLDRVTRIASNRNKTLSNIEKSFLVLFSLALLSFLCTFSWNMQQINRNSRKDNMQHRYQQPIRIASDPWTTTACIQTPRRADRVLIRRSLKSTSRTEILTTTITTVNEQPGTDTLALSQHIITDLARAGIIAEDRLLSYKLNDDELVVNGIKQPATLHHQLKSKYVKNAGWAILYDLQTSTDAPTVPQSKNTDSPIPDHHQVS